MTTRTTAHSRVPGAATSLEYCTVREVTERLAAPLSAEDQTVQSMPDASPTKWHRAHTTWFFETFVLAPHAARYRSFDPQFAFLFNSYYESAGPRHARPERGLITRPGIAEVARYREHVDAAMAQMLGDDPPGPVRALVELGVHHEQQHQELLVMDIVHALSRHPCPTGYGALPWRQPEVSPRPARWIGHDGGIVTVGHDGGGFTFDNEGPRHDVLLAPFEIADRLVTCGDWLAFIDDSGYQRPELWMSAGWATAQAARWSAPDYWYERDGTWQVFGLDGVHDLDPAAPVEHVSWYEADAFARWSGARLPLEAEWETIAPSPAEAITRALDASDDCDGDPSDDGNGDDGNCDRGGGQWYGAVWQWTASPYTAYPGFRPAAGAVGEYNGKFMVNQHVLRGSCQATPPGHARRTYRNFFPAESRWMFAGLRLARDRS